MIQTTRVTLRCPLCDWSMDEPPMEYVPWQDGWTPGDWAEASLMRHLQVLDGAMREHFAAHTARIILSEDVSG